MADGTEVTREETRFVWDGHVVVHELDAAVGLTTWYWDPGTFTPIAKEHNGHLWSIASDHLGTPTEMYDDLGQLAWKMQLDVYGVPEFETGDEDDCPWRWPGQYEDRETGDYYNRWRYYDARGGGYVSRDPIGLRGGTPLFGYVRDPGYSIDPRGLNPFLFRGTSQGFPGNASVQRIGISPATTHPGVATIFGTHSNNFGQGTVQIFSAANLDAIERIPGNVLSQAEREVGLVALPRDLAERAGRIISPAEARAILADMGIDVPGSLPRTNGNLTDLCRGLEDMTDTEIRTFVDRAGGCS